MLLSHCLTATMYVCACVSMCVCVGMCVFNLCVCPYGCLCMDACIYNSLTITCISRSYMVTFMQLILFRS